MYDVYTYHKNKGYVKDKNLYFDKIKDRQKGLIGIRVLYSSGGKFKLADDITDFMFDTDTNGKYKLLSLSELLEKLSKEGYTKIYLIDSSCNGYREINSHVNNSKKKNKELNNFINEYYKNQLSKRQNRIRENTFKLKPIPPSIMNRLRRTFRRQTPSTNTQQSSRLMNRLRSRTTTGGHRKSKLN